MKTSNLKGYKKKQENNHHLILTKSSLIPLDKNHYLPINQTLKMIVINLTNQYTFLFLFFKTRYDFQKMIKYNSHEISRKNNSILNVLYFFTKTINFRLIKNTY